MQIMSEEKDRCYYFLKEHQIGVCVALAGQFEWHGA